MVGLCWSQWFCSDKSVSGSFLQHLQFTWKFLPAPPFVRHSPLSVNTVCAPLRRKDSPARVHPIYLLHHSLGSPSHMYHPLLLASWGFFAVVLSPSRIDEARKAFGAKAVWLHD